MHDDVHLASLLFVYGLLLGNCGYQTDRKIYDQSEIAFRSQSSCNLRTVCATKLTAARPARIIIILSFGYLHESRTPTCTCYSYGILNVLIRVKH